MEDPVIRYRTVGCALGWLLVAGTVRGVCNVRFGERPEALVRGLAAEFPFAVIEADPPGATALGPWVEAVLRIARGEGRDARLPLDVRGSQFQRRVWSAIQAIPPGRTRSYGELAAAVGRPRAARAVAAACAANPVALLVPCHRVVGSGGRLGGYRYGSARKRALLAAEAGQPCEGAAPGPGAGAAPLRASS